MSTCFFIGHRDASENIFPQLKAEVARHVIEYGVTDFLVGSYGNFDSLAAQAVKEVKVHCPGVTLTRLLPYHPKDRPVPIVRGFDGAWYPPGMEYVPKKYAIVQANRQAVDASTHLIAYVSRPSSNSHELLEYAQKREKQGLIRVTNLVDSPRIK